MTTDELDELDLLTNPELVKKGELEASRSSFRPEWLEATFDIPSQEIRPYTVDRNGRDIRMVNLHLTNFKCIRAVAGSVWSDDEVDWEMVLPDKANSHAEISLVVESANKVDPKVSSIRHFPGLKNVHVSEKIHKYTGRRPTGEKDEDGKDIWNNSTPLQTWYYHVEKIGNKGTASSNGASAPKSEAPETLSEESITYALSLIGDDGVEEADFKAKAIRDKTVQSDKLLMNMVTKGVFIDNMVTEGKVIRDGELVRLTNA